MLKYVLLRLLWELIFVFATVLMVSCAEATIMPGSSQIKSTITRNSYLPHLWRVPSKAKITLQLKNEDTLPHHWTLLKAPLTPPFSQDDEENILFDTMIPPATTMTVEFNSPAAPGEYDVVGEPQSILNGLLGTLLVVQ